MSDVDDLRAAMVEVTKSFTIPHIQKILGDLCKMSDLEDLLAIELRANGIAFHREYQFHPKRKFRADLARRDEQIAELTATTHSQAVRNAELLRFVWWVYQVYARNVQELTSGITEACTYETEEKAEKGKYGLPIRCWEYIRHLEEYTAGIYNGTYLDSETSTGVKDPPAGHWKSHVDPKELE